MVVRPAAEQFFAKIFKFLYIKSCPFSVFLTTFIISTESGLWILCDPFGMVSFIGLGSILKTVYISVYIFTLATMFALI